jgi:hypothetical protein
MQLIGPTGSIRPFKSRRLDKFWEGLRRMSSVVKRGLTCRIFATVIAASIASAGRF